MLPLSCAVCNQILLWATDVLLGANIVVGGLSDDVSIYGYTSQQYPMIKKKFKNLKKSHSSTEVKQQHLTKSAFKLIQINSAFHT